MSSAARQLSLFDFRQKRQRRTSHPTVEEYLSSLVESRLTREVYDNREVRKIAGSVASILRKSGQI